MDRISMLAAFIVSLIVIGYATAFSPPGGVIVSQVVSNCDVLVCEVDNAQ